MRDIMSTAGKSRIREAGVREKEKRKKPIK